MGLKNQLELLESQPWYKSAPKDEQRALTLETTRRYQERQKGRAEELQKKFSSVAELGSSGASREEIAGARADAVRSTVAMRREAQESHGNILTRVASPLIAAGAGFADMGTFGNAANLAAPVGALTLPTSTAPQAARATAEEAARARIGAAKELHPVAFGAGSLAGMFGKTLFTGVTRAAGQIAQPVAKLSAKAAEAVFTSQLGRYVAKLVPQVAANVAGSGLSIGAMNLLSDLGEGEGVGARLQKTIGDTLSPTNLAMSGGAGAIQAGFRATPIPERISLLRRLEREVPGFKATPDMYRDDGLVVGALSNIGQSQIPIASTTATRIARESVVVPLQKSLVAFKRSAGVVDDAVARVEGPLRKALGTPQIPGTLRAGMVARQGGAHSAENATTVPRDALLSFLKTAVAFRRDLGKGAEKRSSELGNIIGDVRGEFARQMRAVKSGKTPRVPYNAKALLNIRQRLDEVINWEDLAKQGRIASRAFSAADVREARDLRNVIGAFVGSSLPQIDAANRNQHAISRVLDQFSTPEALAAIKNAPDGALLKQVFDPKTFFSRTISGKNVMGRWEAFGQSVNQDAKQMASAAYADMYLREMASGPAGRTLPSIWSPLLSKFSQHDDNTGSMFNGQIADAVVPGLRAYVKDRAQMMEFFRRGLGSSIGSQTEPRMAILALGAGAAGVPAALYEMFNDKKDRRVTTILGTLGIIGVIALGRSATAGGAATQLNRLATGAPVIGPTTTAAALAANESPLKRAGDVALGSVGKSGPSAISGVARLLQSR